jgi:hypothetical protein
MHTITLMKIDDHIRPLVSPRHLHGLPMYNSWYAGKVVKSDHISADSPPGFVRKQRKHTDMSQKGAFWCLHQILTFIFLRVSDRCRWINDHQDRERNHHYDQSI